MEKFEGDIILDNQQKTEIHDMETGQSSRSNSPTRNAIRDASQKWPGGFVPYIIVRGQFRWVTKYSVKQGHIQSIISGLCALDDMIIQVGHKPFS